MGIQGLIPFLKNSSRVVSLAEFKGKCAAVDAYGWLHKGAFSCAEKLVKGEPTNGYILYVMKQINLLLSFNVKPILVFDGCHLPSKAGTEAKRRQNREKNRQKAKELLREGKLKEARDYFQRCVDVTSTMAYEVIKACRLKNVDIIVAPYEADAQLAYLNSIGIADVVITEDSDLVMFGCSQILLKLDSNGGGLLIEREKLHLSMGLTADKFSFNKFQYMCILSGCDYLPSLHGIGLAKSKKFFQVSSNPEVFKALCRLPSYLKMPHLEVTVEYREGFIKAINTIQYQLIFDPIEKVLKPLNNYESGTHEDYPYCGEHMGNEKALQIALGNINVQTGEVVDEFNPDVNQGFHKKEWNDNKVSTFPSIWKPNYKELKTAKPLKKSPLRAFSTTGRTTVVAAPRVKRKLECSDDSPDLESLYGCPKKTKESENNQSSFEDSNVTEPKSPTLASRRVVNPFKKMSPASTPRVFSGLRNLSNESSQTIVKSRYFTSPSSPKEIRRSPCKISQNAEETDKPMEVPPLEEVSNKIVSPYITKTPKNPHKKGLFKWKGSALNSIDPTTDKRETEASNSGLSILKSIQPSDKSNCRSVGLSKPAKKQKSLREMFAFKSATNKIPSK